MILVTGTYLRDCTVQCRQSERELQSLTLRVREFELDSQVETSSPQVAVVWYRQVVQYHSDKAINCSQSSCYEADVRP